MQSESIRYDIYNLAWINTQLETNHIHIVSDFVLYPNWSIIELYVVNDWWYCLKMVDDWW